MARFYQGVYDPKNKKKYIGTKKPIFRSSWEYKMFVFLDEHKSVVKWGSEILFIPYQDPFTGKKRKYYPDLIVEYVKSNGRKAVELIEIKPIKETMEENAKTVKDKKSLILNTAKWKAATEWCKHNGIVFRVMTEKDLFI